MPKDDSIKEKQALAFIQEGKLKEAEEIYRDLVTKGSQNYIVYGNLAAICIVKGDKRQGINLLKNTLKLKPDYPDAHYNLGVTLQEQDDLNAAISSYQQAIKFKPIYPEAYNNLGNTFKKQGNFKAAISSYQQAIKLKPDYPVAHYNLGVTLQEQDDLNAAISSYQQAIKLKPDYPIAHNNLGNTFKKKGNFKAAISSFQQAIKLKPDYSEAHNNLGVVLKEQGDLNAAISSYQQAIKLKPDYQLAHYNLGVVYKQKGDLNAAISSYQQAIKLKPDFPEAHNNLGVVLKEQGDLNAAISSLQKAIKLKPDFPEAHNNLGAVLKEKGDLNAAISSLQKAIKLKPDYAEAHNNLGAVLKEQGDLNAAISSFQQAIKLKPDYAEAHVNLGLSFLLNGNYQQGWLGYEYRFKVSDNPATPHVRPTIPQWQGEHLNSIKKLLVVSEQGLGDTLQFMRYIPHLRKLEIDFSFCAQTKLHDLIKVSAISSAPLMPEKCNLIKEGRWIPLLSISKFLDITPENPLVTAPYIHSSAQLIARWKDILSKENAPIIGINWHGNPKAETSTLKGRSIPLELFSILADNHNCKFLSLQKGFGSEQLETCSFKNRFVDCQDKVNEIWEFLETASIIANCDLVITSDTSVAHLAAGMGKPTWCLLQFVPDWRWGTHGGTTFWYPSMKLFRQKERNNWEDVFEIVSMELQLFISKKRIFYE